MKITQHSSINSRICCAWLALIACQTHAETEPYLTTDISVSTFEAGLPSFDTFPLIENLIPLDNPIGAILISKQHPLLLRADFSRVSEFVNQIYRSNNFQPIWLTANRSEKNLKDLLSVINGAAKDALNPANYNAGKILSWSKKQALDSNTAASYDVALTVSLVRYLHDLRQGQIDPDEIQFLIHIARKPPLDVAGLVRQHLASETLTELAALFEPKAKQYQQLKHVLQRLQRSNNKTALNKFGPSKPLHPGDKSPQIVNLRHNLRAMGYLQQENDSESQTYDEYLLAAVKSLQRQQGLNDDGIIGPATVALFNQPPNEKIAQVELAMERARWIPDTKDGPLILVNIPAFELWAFNSADDPKPLNMKVIVGKSPNNQTPILWEEMKYLEFMPYWNIPQSIFKKEILPKTATNRDYLASHEIELIRHQNSAEKGGGSYVRARQRPGSKNPLGRVKFVFPNKADVYLHDTPGRAAFNNPRRDLSHGCVRVSEPERLAEFVLGDQKGWDIERIREAMSAPKTRHVTLNQAVPVLFYYATTFVDPENQLRFYPDIYGHDEQLKQALNKLRTQISST